jgi:multimeric flavodoxin WrbA
VNATILLGSLKKTGLSHTETLCGFLSERMRRADIECEIVKLVDYDIPPGTYANMGAGDQWPEILQKLLASDMVIFATPIWWSNQSSLIQRVIERLDEQHDHLMAGKASGFEGKVGGIVITGDSDGAQQIIGHICNFFNAIGVLVPPFATLSVLWDRQAKNANPSREELLKKYEEDYGSTADRMIQQMLAYVAVKATTG